MSRTLPYPMSEIERENLTRLAVNYNDVQALPQIWAIAAEKFSDIVALHDPHSKPAVQVTYAQLYDQIRQFAAGLQALGIEPTQDSKGFPPRISLFADNSPRWFIADQGIMAAGAANAVRSSQADREELLYILEHSGSIGLVVEDLATLNKLQERLSASVLRFVILLTDETPATKSDIKLLTFSDVMELGAKQPFQPVRQTTDTLATLIYTSGTTGKPKGVMLTHGNLMHQVTTMGTVVQPEPGDRVLSILPTWHSYERSVEYFLLSQGSNQIYTSIRTIKKDLKEFKPHYMVSVPRIWESLYDAIQKQFREQPAKKQKLIRFFLGISQQYIEAKRIWENLDLLHLDIPTPERLLAGFRAAVFYPLHAIGEKIVYAKVREGATGGVFRQAISGGGSLAKHLDDFFEIVGVSVLVGYGLTETSPVTNARRPWRNLRGSAGQPIPGTEIRIVHPETRKPAPQGEKGLVLIRGPQVMQGYYQNPEATAKAIDPEGWFDSGDLGWVTRKNDLILTGRAKDTIVLTNGENIEPQPIEDACLRSSYITQIMLVGQDQKALGALIVPNLETLQEWALSKGYRLDMGDAVESAQNPPLTLDSKPIQDLFRQELNREVQNRPGFRIDDRIGPFRFIQEPFSIDNGLLTQTLKVRRNVVMDRYQGMIDEMFV